MSEGKIFLIIEKEKNNHFATNNINNFIIFNKC